jgi:hypothetical protein
MAEPLKQSKKALLFYKKEAKNFLIWTPLARQWRPPTSPQRRRQIKSFCALFSKSAA